MLRILASVGRGGTNNPHDVKVVQQLLNRTIADSRPLLAVDGVAGARTITEIEFFQRVIGAAGSRLMPSLGMRTTTPMTLNRMAAPAPEPLGLVTVHGPTITALGGSRAEAIAWGRSVSREFRFKLNAICERLDIPVDFLMSAMAFETGESFSPGVLSQAGSGATGLIQFMPSIAERLGTTVEELKSMTAEQQLDYVEKYFTPYKGRLRTLADVYMAILWPKAVGEGEDDVLFRQGTIQYAQNRGLDLNKDDEVTVSEAAAIVRRKFAKGVSPTYLG